MIEQHPVYLMRRQDLEGWAYRCTQSWGTSFIARAGEGGKVLVDNNICPHRGFPIVNSANLGEKGTPLPTHCPYHGMAFKAAGDHPAFVIGDFIFATARPFAVPKGWERLEWFSERLGERFHHRRTDVAAPWELWVQQTMDPHHVAHVHRSGFATQFLDLVSPEDVFFSDDLRVSGYRIPVKDEVFKRYFEMLCSRPQLAGAPVPEPYFRHITVFPGLSITSFLGVFFSVEETLPMKFYPDQSVVFTEFFSARDMRVPPILLKRAADSNEKILQEDKRALEAFVSGGCPEREPGFFMAGEERIKIFRTVLEASR